MVRKLIIVKVFHTPREADVEHMHKLTKTEYRAYEQFWKTVDQSLEKKLRMEDFSRLRLYQDMEYGGDWQIDKDMAKHPERFNHRMLLKLKDRWEAELMPTELDREEAEELFA